ncbi:hypothetical protein N658DRAFT_495850 [Parathielavia hyrcaniae]|uniref:Uncharacterized protein n=1 Tax=Parathielavia hyrcaniae TaxID=113614 RepID=A0AAN6Q456_9PEZI|nr:hypothetical protein N658DRAFT_495850 [Parathielavia hyrcaniae]
MSSIQSNLEPDPSGDNNGNNGVSSSSNNHSHGAPHVEDLEPAHARKPIEPEAITPAWAVLSKVAFLVYISLMMAYLFLSGQGPGEDRGRINTARLIVLVLWMVNSGVLFLCHGQYLTRHKREIASAFFISAVGLHYLVGAGEAALADTIGVVMVCIVIATLCPGLLRLWLWPLGMASSP